MRELFVISIFLALASCASLPTQQYAVDSSARIVNGYAIDISEIPYQAALRRRVAAGWTHSCGAVIISNMAVLTAAHCVDLYVTQPSSLRIVVGTSYRLTGGQAYDVSKVIAHESFSTTTLENDIALLGVASPIVFSSSVDSIPIASSSTTLLPGTEALVSGYGILEFAGAASSVLQAARVNIVAQETCARAYLRIANIASGMVCASGVLPPRDACQGDSGGPLVADGILVGLVSWGEGCADTSYPGVYTRVSEYNSWIVSSTNQL